MIVIFFGPPGAGKGTMADRLKNDFGFLHISTGDAFREIMTSGTEFGNKIKNILNQGILVDDETTAKVLQEKLKKVDKSKTIILDGYPRNINQARILEKLLTELDMKVEKVVFFEAPREKIVARLSSRRICSNCKKVYGTKVPPKIEGICDSCSGKLVQREDDKAEAINKRLEVEEKQVRPIVEEYSQKGLVEKINASVSVEDVYKQVLDTFKLEKE